MVIGLSTVERPLTASRKRRYEECPVDENNTIAASQEPPSFLIDTKHSILGEPKTNLSFFNAVRYTVSGLINPKRYRLNVEQPSKTSMTNFSKNSGIKLLKKKLHDKPNVIGNPIRKHRPVTTAVQQATQGHPKFPCPIDPPPDKVKRRKDEYRDYINKYSSLSSALKSGRKYLKKFVKSKPEKSTKQFAGPLHEEVTERLESVEKLIPEIPDGIELADCDAEDKKVKFERTETVDTLKTATDLDGTISSQSLAELDQEIPSQEHNQLDQTHISISDDEYEQHYSGGSEYSSEYQVDDMTVPAASSSGAPATSSRIAECEENFRAEQEKNRDLEAVDDDFKRLWPARTKRCKQQPKLTEFDLDDAEKAINAHSAKLICKKYRLEIYGNTMRTLGHLQWLDDNVINFYMEMINERSKTPGADYPQVWAVSTFFFSALCEKGYNGVRRWSKRQKIDVFSLSYLIVPVHLGVHWTISVVDLISKTITFYDSMGGSSRGYNEALLDYLEKEHQNYKGSPLPDVDDYELLSARRDSPQQDNGSDCGVFSCCIAENVSRCGGYGGWNFEAAMMPEIRKKMAIEIERGELF